MLHVTLVDFKAYNLCSESYAYEYIVVIYGIAIIILLHSEHNNLERTMALSPLHKSIS